MSLVQAAPYIARTVANTATGGYGAMTLAAAPYAYKAAKYVGKSLLKSMQQKKWSQKKALGSSKRKKGQTVRNAKRVKKTPMIKKKKMNITTSEDRNYQVRNQTIVLSKKPVAKTYGRWKFTQLHQNVSQSIAGLQAYTPLYRALSRNNGLGTGADPGGTGFRSLIDFRDMNPYRKLTGSTLHNVASDAIPLNDPFVVKNIRIETEVCNVGNTPCDLDLYWYTPKNNGNSVFIDNWEQALINDGPQGQAQWTPCIPGGVAPSGSVKTGGFADAEFPGERPFANRNIRKNYRLLKMVHVNLAVSTNQLINTTLVVNKKVQPRILFQLDDSEDIRNLTVYCFAIQRGTAVLDTTNAGATKATYGKSQIAFVHRVTYNMCGVRDNANRVDVNYVGSCIPANTADDKQIHVEDESGVLRAALANYVV